MTGVELRRTEQHTANHCTRRQKQQGVLAPSPLDAIPHCSRRPKKFWKPAFCRRQLSDQ